VNIVRYADRPDLLERRYDELTKPTFHEYMNSNKPGGRYRGRVYTDFPDFVADPRSCCARSPRPGPSDL